MFPAGNQSLSVLGAEQAHCLGRHMKSLDFGGVIYSSPYIRTLETSQIVAEHTNTEIIPAPFIREIFKTQEASEEFEGSDSNEILAKYSKVTRDLSLDYPWWIQKKEDFKEDVCKRVFSGLDSLESGRDILIVGHGASVDAVFSYYGITKDGEEPVWNCSLSMYNDESGEMYCNDVSFIPYEKNSSNVRLLCEWEAGIEQE